MVRSSTPQRPPASTPGSGSSTASEQQDLEKLAKQIADRVWKLWQEELRQTRERRSSNTRK